ncbi:hypothetical protein WN944_014975 [Citrus x changshan-huyou]|uniref:Uncharacterized protein n=1 Tax=Citrus x changshan-huyou TaxID=2935761 RepID=A0AAP0M8U7_9ROSI
MVDYLLQRFLKRGRLFCQCPATNEAPKGTWYFKKDSTPRWAFEAMHRRPIMDCGGTTMAVGMRKWTRGG